MDEAGALRAFAALSQETRLRMVRILVTAGPDGLAAGAVGEAVRASSSNVSFHLKELEAAGLIRSRRASRSIIYSPVYPALSALIRFLLADCCGGRAEICAPALAQFETCCPASEPEHA